MGNVSNKDAAESIQIDVPKLKKELEKQGSFLNPWKIAYSLKDAVKMMPNLPSYMGTFTQVSKKITILI